MDWQFEQHGARICFIATAAATERLIGEAETQLARRRSGQLDRPLAAQDCGPVAQRRDRIAAELAKAHEEVRQAEAARRQAMDAWTGALQDGRDAKAPRAACDRAQARQRAAKERLEALEELARRTRRDAELERTALIRQMALRVMRMANEAAVAASGRGDEALSALARKHLAALMLRRHAEHLEQDGRTPNG